MPRTSEPAHDSVMSHSAKGLDPVDIHAVAILLDVDGTVLDIAPTPGAVMVPVELMRVLARLSTAMCGALAFVSGRLIADLDGIFAPLRLPCVGAHGAEVRLPDGSVMQFATTLAPDLVARLASLARAHAGVLVEDKGYSVAIHYRLAPELGPTILSEVRRIRAEFPDQALELLPGKSVVEVKRPKFDKGTGVRALMAHEPFAERRPIFIGDDVTDEPCFEVVKDYGGVGLSVGRDIAGALGRFERPADVRRWLRRVAADVDAS